MTIGLAFAFCGGALQARDSTGKTLKLTTDLSQIDRDAFDRVSYAAVVKRAAPSVVDVVSTTRVKAPDMSQSFNDPLFRHFFGTSAPASS